MAAAQILLLCCLAIIYSTYVSAKPHDLNSFNGQTDLERCNRIPEVDIQCQKCAKITKSPMAYPMCCTDKEDAYRWCVKYINFGLQKRSHQKEFPPWERKHMTKQEQRDALKKHLTSMEISEMYLPEVDTNMV